MAASEHITDASLLVLTSRRRHRTAASAYLTYFSEYLLGAKKKKMRCIAGENELGVLN
jgi:hypothetical protein